jgi:hypothetical protein
MQPFFYLQRILECRTKMVRSGTWFLAMDAIFGTFLGHPAVCLGPLPGINKDSKQWRDVYS